MQNRTAAVIITIIAILLCGCPGLAVLCFGLSSLADYAAGFGIFASDQNTYIWFNFRWTMCRDCADSHYSLGQLFRAAQEKRNIYPLFPKSLSHPPALTNHFRPRSNLV